MSGSMTARPGGILGLGWRSVRGQATQGACVGGAARGKLGSWSRCGFLGPVTIVSADGRECHPGETREAPVLADLVVHAGELVPIEG